MAPNYGAIFLTKKDTPVAQIKQPKHAMKVHLKSINNRNHTSNTAVAPIKKTATHDLLLKQKNDRRIQKKPVKKNKNPFNFIKLKNNKTKKQILAQLLRIVERLE